MRMCNDHWAAMRQAVEDRGMTHLVARSGEDAMASIVDQLQGGTGTWDPLMAMNNNFFSAALEYGGLGMLTQPPEGHGHMDGGERAWCPLCEAKIRGDGPDTDKVWIAECADAMLAHARDKGLVPVAQ